MTSDIHYQQLRDARLFQDFPDDVLKDLATHCRSIELRAGQSLFQQSDPGNNFYLLTEGQIHVVRRYPSGEDIILATEGPYYVVGELSMLANEERTGGVTAVSDSTLIELDRAHFIAACEHNPKASLAVISYLSLRLHRMNLLIREYAIGNLAARVASMLLLLCGNKAGPIDTLVRVNRIARAIATDGDSVERTLQTWVKRNYITYTGSTISVINIEAIRDIAG